MQGIGKVNVPIVNAAIALFVQTAVLVPLLLFTNLNIYALAITNTVYSGVMCILNQISVRKALGYKQEVFRTFVLPGFAAGFMGAIAWVVYEIVNMIVKINVVCIIPAIGMAVVAYFVLLILFKGVTEGELRALPKGYLLVKLAKKCRLM